MSVKSIIDTLICERAPWLSADNRPIRCIDRALKLALGYDKTLSLAHTLSPMSGADILKRTSADIAQDVRVEGLHNIPRSGAALIVANHPTGIADAIVLFKALSAKRPDLYFFANRDVLRVFPQLGTHIAPVEWRKDKRSASKSRETLEYAKAAMAEGRLGVIFPSGRLAKRHGITLVERDWMISAVSLAKRYDVPIIPIHISARNSILFYLLDLIHPTLRDITLFHETINKKDFHFAVNIGAPILPSQLDADHKIATDQMKQAVLDLNSGPFLNSHRLGLTNFAMFKHSQS